jgi:hypothetical protein
LDTYLGIIFQTHDVPVGAAFRWRVETGTARVISVLTHFPAPLAVRITNKCPAGEADFSRLEFPVTLFFLREAFMKWLGLVIELSQHSGRLLPLVPVKPYSV